MDDTTKKPRSRSRSRDEVKQDFDNLQTPQRLSQKEREARAQRAGELRHSIADITAEKAAQALATAGVAMQKSLSAVNEELTTRLAQLASIKENIEIEAAELSRLYGAGTILEHLDVLMAQHDEKKLALEQEIAAARQQWAEQKVAQEKERIREADEFNYRRAQERKTDQDRWQESVRARQIAEADRLATLEKGWAQREEELKLREKELVDLRTAVAGHQAEIDKAVKAAEAIVHNRLTKDHMHAMQLLEKDRASEKSLYEADKKSLIETNARLEKLVVELRTELAEANRKNAEIATKALESTSSREALTTLQTSLKDAGLNGGIRKS